MAAGLIVTHPRFRKIKDGQWVRIFGRLSILPEAWKLRDLPKVEEAPYYSMVDTAVFLADTVEVIERPDSVYLYQLPRSEWFDY